MNIIEDHSYAATQARRAIDAKAEHEATGASLNQSLKFNLGQWNQIIAAMQRRGFDDMVHITEYVRALVVEDALIKPDHRELARAQMPTVGSIIRRTIRPGRKAH